MERLFLLLCCVCFIVSTHFAEPLEIGDVCDLHDGKKGTCQVNTKCTIIVDGLKKKTFNIKDIRNCGFSGNNPVVCCPTTQQITDRINRKKYVEQCEIYSNKTYSDLAEHILGGVPTDPGEFPHMAAIGYKSSEGDNTLSYLCGGALISKNFVLTAAHCFIKREFKATSVKLGRVSLLYSEDPENDDDKQPHIDILVKNVTKHPKYSSRLKYHDIALIELIKDVSFTYYARPACLYHSDVKIDPNLSITGWGVVNTDKRETSPFLLKGEVHEVDFNQCKSQYDSLLLNSLPDGLTKSQICATGQNADKVVDACQGDSGGPLSFKLLVNKEYVHYVYGIVSFGAACGNENYVGIYTRVSDYLDWIQNIVWP